MKDKTQANEDSTKGKKVEIDVKKKTQMKKRYHQKLNWIKT